MFTLEMLALVSLIADPNLLPKLQVDKGAIKFILSGANIMAPGLTSPGARMDIDLPADTVVVSRDFIIVSYFKIYKYGMIIKIFIC